MARRKSSAAVAETRGKLQGARAAAGVDLDDAAFRKGLAQWWRRMEIKSEAELQRVAIRVQNEARKLCPVDTGRLRSSIQHTPGTDAQGPYVDVGTNVEYGPHVEYGTQHSAAQPFMRPALLLAGRWWVEAMRGGV